MLRRQPEQNDRSLRWSEDNELSDRISAYDSQQPREVMARLIRELEGKIARGFEKRRHIRTE
jgi:hypothetical protein